MGPVMVYTLVGQNGVLYVGCTTGLDQRLDYHRYTKPWYADVVDIRCESYIDRLTALRRERELIQALAPRYNVQHNNTSRRHVSRQFVDWRIADLGLTNAQVAKFLDVSAGQFSRLKSGERNIRDDQAHALAHILRSPVALVAPLPAPMEATA